MISTNLSTKSNLFDQGNSPNNFESPEPSGTIFNVAKPFNLGDISKPVNAANDEEYGKAGAEKSYSEKKNKKGRIEHEVNAPHPRGFIYSLWESVLKCWTNALLTSSSAEVVVNAIVKGGEGKRLSDHLENQCLEAKNLLEKSSLSEEQKKQVEQKIQDLEKRKLDPNTVEYNAFNNNAEKTYSDSFLSRLLTDIGIDQAIATFRRHFPEFAKKYPIVNTLIGDMVARPVTFLTRTVTAENNISTSASNHAGKASPEQQKIIEAMKDTGVARLIRWIRGEDENGEEKKGEHFSLKACLDPLINGVNKYLLGISPGEILKDANGEALYTTVDLENGKKKRIPVKSLAKFNPLHFGITCLTSLGLTAFTLDKKAQATGFQDADSTLKVFSSIALSNANRIDSAMNSYVHNSVREGESFPGIFNRIIPKKLLMPMCQNVMKGISNLLPGDKINPATKSILLNMVVEFIAPPFVQNFMPTAEKRAIDKEIQFVSHKLLKPPLAELIGALKKGWIWWGQNFHAAIGTYPGVIKPKGMSLPFWAIQQTGKLFFNAKPKDIPGLFNDKKKEVFDEGLPEELKEYKDAGVLKTAGLAAKSLVKAPLNVANWLPKSLEANKTYTSLSSGIQEAANLLSELKKAKPAEAANDGEYSVQKAA